MRRLSFVLGVVLLLGIVSASSYMEKYYEDRFYSDDLTVVSKTVYTQYDNDNRFSTYDYRHGYSYRTTKDYYESHRSVYPEYLNIKVRIEPRLQNFKDRHYFSKYDYNKRDYGVIDLGRSYYSYDYGYSRPVVSYEYVPYMKKYEKKECYFNPPANSLFYVKC